MVPIDNVLKVLRLAERVSASKGAPHSKGRSSTDEWRPTLHGGRAEVEDDLAAHELAAAKRRRQDSELKDQVQKETGLATATFRGGNDEKRVPMRLAERKATDAGPRAK